MDPEILRFLWEPRRAKVNFNLDEKLAATRSLPAVAQLLKNFATICQEQSQ